MNWIDSKNNDRFTDGFLAGLIGGIAMAVFSYLGYYVIHFPKMIIYDWAAVIIFGVPSNTLLEKIVAQAAHLMFTGFLGILFAYLVPLITSRNYLLKGWLFGVGSWFIIYSVTFLFNVPYLSIVPVETVISNFNNSMVYGLVLAWSFEWLLHRGRIKK